MHAFGKELKCAKLYVLDKYWKNGEEMKDLAQDLGYGILFRRSSEMCVFHSAGNPSDYYLGAVISIDTTVLATHSSFFLFTNRTALSLPPC